MADLRSFELSYGPVPIGAVLPRISAVLHDRQAASSVYLGYSEL